MPKSDHEKAEIRRQAEARRQPEKDRSAHDAQRNQKMRTLADISRERPTEDELLHYSALIAKESDRGSAVMAAALVENALMVCACSRLANPSPETVKSWFEDHNAPFATFSAKIKLGRALGIYEAQMEKRLTVIKDIRNAFAHASRPLDFSDPTVADAVLQLNISPKRYKGRKDRVVFWSACLAVSRSLIASAFEHGGKEIVVDFPDQISPGV